MNAGVGDVGPPPAHAEATYLPARARSGIALCLSGGGFRAALFHLGALQRLHELGVLRRVDTITSVSGGSLTAAALAAAHVRAPGRLDTLTVPEWRAAVAAPLEALTSRNIRTGAAVLNVAQLTSGDAMAPHYRELTGTLALAALPASPRFVFCATDLAWGVNWVFERTRLGDFQAGYALPPREWDVARSVAASACFPPVFNPIPVDLEPVQLTGGLAPPGAERDVLIRGLRLSDGGVYDDLALEPVWKDHAVVLVSDGGALFRPEEDRGPLRRLPRYVDIQGRQSLALRKRWLVSSFLAGQMSGAYWGVGGARESYDLSGGYSKLLATDAIAAIRTDFDAFSDAETAVLQNHGYLLADAAVARHAPGLVTPGAPRAEPPRPEWLPPATNEDAVRSALSESGSVRLLGRGFLRAQD